MPHKIKVEHTLAGGRLATCNWIDGHTGKTTAQLLAAIEPFLGGELTEDHSDLIITILRDKQIYEIVNNRTGNVEAEYTEPVTVRIKSGE